jgi:hypothetical protein
MPALVCRAAFVAASAVWLSACGTATSPVPGGGSPPGSPGSPGASLTLADNGATIRVSTGQVVAVALSQRGAFGWHVPVAIGTAVRRTSASGGYPGKAPARAAFRAEQPGRAVLASADDIACLHSHPACLVPQRSWRVTVIVMAAH